MSDYGREWQRIHDRIENVQDDVVGVTGTKFFNAKALQEHIHKLQALCAVWVRYEHDIANITASDDR